MAIPARLCQLMLCEDIRYTQPNQQVTYIISYIKYILMRGKYAQKHVTAV